VMVAQGGGKGKGERERERSDGSDPSAASNGPVEERRLHEACAQRGEGPQPLSGGNRGPISR